MLSCTRRPGCRPPPPDGLEHVGVAVRELERRGALARDLGERFARRTDGEQDAGRASAQPQRCGHAPRQLALQVAQRSGRLSGRSPGPARARPRCAGVLRLAGEVEQPRAVDVDHVQRHGDAGDALSLCDELVGDEGAADLIEDMERFERERLGATQLTRREKPAGDAPSAASS